MISTGMADPDFLEKIGFTLPSYSIAKAAANMVNTSYGIALKDEGFTFLAISPGLVNTAVKPRKLLFPNRISVVNSLALSYTQGAGTIPSYGRCFQTSGALLGGTGSPTRGLR